MMTLTMPSFHNVLGKNVDSDNHSFLLQIGKVLTLIIILPPAICENADSDNSLFYYELGKNVDADNHSFA
jgi:hypothetical protein